MGNKIVNLPLKNVPEKISDVINKLCYDILSDKRSDYINSLWLIGQCLEPEFSKGDKIEVVPSSVSVEHASDVYSVVMESVFKTEISDRFLVYLPGTKLSDVMGWGCRGLRLL